MMQSEIVTEQGAHPIPTLGRKRQVLVVDDNKAVREALSRMLVSLGHNVTLSSNGFDGGLLFCTRSYDLAIIDLEVPQMNVWELSRIFKDHSPRTPVIVVTRFCDNQASEKMNPNSVDSIVPKPFKLNEIEGTVRRLLNSAI
jgi:CheY-like chemotaxis protein